MTRVEQRDQGLEMDDWSEWTVCYRIGVEQRLPDLQARSGTVGLWTTATGLVATATGLVATAIATGLVATATATGLVATATATVWLLLLLLRVWLLRVWLLLLLLRVWLLLLLLRVWLLLLRFLSSFFSDFFRSQVEVILRMSAAHLFAALDRRVKDSEYCRTEQERSSNDEQVLILLFSIFPSQKILQ
jgi:hypothetical protein